MIVHRDERRGRAESFAGVADAYERGRPGYPAEAVRWLVGETPRDVVDVGAGTGKLTRSLVEAGHRVTAVDPLPEMLERLRRAVPGAETVEGRAEAIPLPDASVDVAVGAQAFHWFDHDAALPELARVLRPRGRLALVWNVRDDREPWVQALSAAIGRESVEPRDVEEVLGTSLHFGAVERARFEHAQCLERDALRDLVLSRSYCAVRTQEERAPILAEVDRLFDAYGDGTAIRLPYVTECFRAPRAP